MNIDFLEPQDRVASSDEIERRVRAAVDQHEMFRGRAGNFEFIVRDHVLTLCGKVPNFYLKQMLQTVVRGIEGVQAINNNVEVIS
jgi:hypothetical protein